jgi:hypothetical protein
MIFKIVDARPNFYQWDINRQIAVSDPTITEVHFCNRTDVCSLVVAVVDGIANVPNILLQSGFSIRVFGYDGQATLHEATFEVKARTKPTDYVYTETEIKQFSDLESRIDEIEEKGISEEVVNKAVTDYLEANLEDLTGDAITIDINCTVEEFLEAVESGKAVILMENVVSSSTNATDYFILVTANRSNSTNPRYYFNRLSLQNGLIYLYQKMASVNLETSPATLAWTSSYKSIQETIYFNRTPSANAEVLTSFRVGSKDYTIKNSEVDLTDYAKKTDIPDVSSFISAIPEEYVTESELEAKGYAKVSALNDKANTNHTHSEYAKTKHTHDMADVNGLQNALSAKASQSDIDKAIELHNHNNLYATKEHNHDDKYSTKGHVHSYNDLTNKPTIPSIEGLASEAYVDNAIANIDIPSVEGFIKEIPAEYVTETELNNKGYITEHQSLEGYATETYVDNAIANIEVSEGLEEVTLLFDGENGPMKRVYGTNGGYIVEQVKKIFDNPEKCVLKVYCPYTDDYFGGNTSAKPVYYTFSRIASSSEFNKTIQYVTIIPMGGYTGDNLIVKLSYVNVMIAYNDDGSLDIATFQPRTQVIPESGGEGADLSNYYTKEETTQAIQDALDAIGVAEGGAY